MGELRVDTLSAENGTSPVDLTGQSAAKAWCAINGSQAVADSFNVSSVTDVGGGIIDYSYTNSMGLATNAILIGGNDNNFGNKACFQQSSSSVSGTRTVFVEGNSTTLEDDYINVAVLGDLA